MNTNDSFANGQEAARYLLSMWRENLHNDPISAFNELLTYASEALASTNKFTDYERELRQYYRGQLAYCKSVIISGNRWEGRLNQLLVEQSGPDLSPDGKRNVDREIGRYILHMSEHLDTFTVQFLVWSKGITPVQQDDYKWSYRAAVLKHVDEQNKPAQTNEEAA